MDLTAVAFVLVMLGLLAGIIASGRGQPFGSFFFLGCLLGPLGLLIAATSTQTPEKEAERQKAIDEARNQLGG